MNRTIRHAILLAFAGAISASPALAQKKETADKSGTLATVNGKIVPKSRSDILAAGQMRQGIPDSPELRKQIGEELVRREILSQEAVKKALDKKPEVQVQLDLARQDVLVGAYLNEYARTHPVTEAAIKTEYEVVKAKLGDKEYKARHVLVEKEDEAKAIIDSLKKGAKFEDVAKQSKDPGSKDRGGELGWANRASFTKPFADAMVQLAAGKYTETPIMSEHGWHVIQLDETRDLKLPSIDEAKGQISQQLQRRMVQQHGEELRAKAKVQ
jgi:peptidyl-prolyl cis-trans isomerase C